MNCCIGLQLKEDVAGATFMAAGSSAPELATGLIGTFISKVWKWVKDTKGTYTKNSDNLWKNKRNSSGLESLLGTLSSRK